MASPAQVANDLDAQANDLRGGGFYEDHDRHAASYARGAKTIRELLEEISYLERAAEEAEDRLIAYKNGDDLYDGGGS